MESGAQRIDLSARDGRFDGLSRPRYRFVYGRATRPRAQQQNSKEGKSNNSQQNHLV